MDRETSQGSITAGPVRDRRIRSAFGKRADLLTPQGVTGQIRFSRRPPVGQFSLQAHIHAVRCKSTGRDVGTDAVHRKTDVYTKDGGLHCVNHTPLALLALCHPCPAGLTAVNRAQTFCTFFADGPRSPFSTSKVTRSPSASVLNPDILMAEW